MKNKTRDRFYLENKQTRNSTLSPSIHFHFVHYFDNTSKKQYDHFCSQIIWKRTYFLRFLIKLQNAYTILLNSIWHGLWNLSQSRKFQYSGSWKTFLSPSDTIKCRMTLYLINGWLMKDQLPAFMQITS